MQDCWIEVEQARIKDLSYDIRDLLSYGFNKKEVAEKLNISRATVHRYIVEFKKHYSQKDKDEGDKRGTSN